MGNKVIGALPYSLSMRPVNPGDAESERKIFPSLQERECVSLKQLAAHMSDHGTPFSSGTIQGVLTDMVSCTKELLKAGYSVELQGLAKFYLTCSSEGSDTVQDFTTSKIKRINIRTDVDSEASAYVNTDVDYEYVMTREEQAAAKRAAKLTLPQEETTGENSGGSSNDGGDGGGDSGVTE